MSLVYQSHIRSAVLAADLPAPSYLVDHRATPTPKRFAVYRNNVVVSLVEALMSGFASLVPLVGETFFRAVAREYAVKHPPTSPLMLFYGEGFAAFLETFEPTKNLPFLPPVARIDWAWRQAYHAADTPPLGAHDLGRIAAERWNEARLTLHPAVWIGTSDVAAFDLWRVGRSECDPSDVGSAPQACLVARPGLRVLVNQISPGIAVALQRVQAGDTLATALEAGLAAEAALDVSAFIQLLIDQGLVVAIDLN